MSLEIISPSTSHFLVLNVEYLQVNFKVLSFFLCSVKLAFYHSKILIPHHVFNPRIFAVLLGFIFSPSETKYENLMYILWANCCLVQVWSNYNISFLSLGPLYLRKSEILSKKISIFVIKIILFFFIPPSITDISSSKVMTEPQAFSRTFDWVIMFPFVEALL